MRATALDRLWRASAAHCAPAYAFDAISHHKSKIVYSLNSAAIYCACVSERGIPISLPSFSEVQSLFVKLYEQISQLVRVRSTQL